MKRASFILSILSVMACVAGETGETQDIVDVPGKTEDPNTIPVGHIKPDINCLVNHWSQFFAETTKEMNGLVHPEPFNMALDPFIIDLNHRIEEKTEGVDSFISIKDINEYFKIDDEEHQELRVFLDECSHIPEKVGLEINELNYYFCTVVWKNGFDIFSDKLVKKAAYRKGFFRIVETSVGQIFNYKTYMRSILLTPFMGNYWRSFYSNFNEYLNLNQNYENYNREIIIGIKQTNYFFNVEEMQDKNVFFKFYLNNLEILRALNEAYFYFTIEAEVVMQRVQEHSENFRQIIVDELYGSLFYLFMRNDDVFLESFDKFARRAHFLIPAMTEAFEKTYNDIIEHTKREIEKDNTFDSTRLEPQKPRQAMGVPSEHPLLNSELDKYKDRKDFSEMPLFGRVQPSEKELILTNNAKAKVKVAEGAKMQKFLKGFRLMGNGELSPMPEGRILQSINRKMAKHMNRRKAARRRAAPLGAAQRRAFHEFEAFDQKLRTPKPQRALFKVPAQPELNDPQKFFERMDELKRPLPIKKRRLKLTDFFQMYEDRVVKSYGLSINIDLVRICKQHMTSRIVQIANIFCLILQRETHLLVQQKYANSKLKAFIEKYLPFITFNFFTYFRVLEDKGDLVDIAVLTLFYNEKLFSAIKLAIVSLNNLVMHYEEEYQGFYRNRLESAIMPLLNHFKYNMMKAFFSFGDDLKTSYVLSFQLAPDDIRIDYLPLFRKTLDSLILRPTCDEQNEFELKQQYNNYINSMNLLSFDTIKQKFLAYSQKTGLVVSSEGPKKECEEVFLMDIAAAHKREMMARQGKGALEDDEEYKCIKNWKLYDEVFHNIFFNTDSKEVVIKSKTSGSITEKNQFDAMMENELKRIVNYFVPSRMKAVLEEYTADNEFGLRRCGVLSEYSRSSCFAIFGNNNCRSVTGTIYYTRVCPAGYRPDGIGCSFDCKKVNMEEDGDFCHKEDPNLPCPSGSIVVDPNRCLKPMRRYFMYIQNPFNNKA